MSERPKTESRLSWGSRKAGSLRLGRPRGLCFPLPAVVGEGRPAGGPEASLRGNNGAKGVWSSQTCPRGRAAACCKVSSCFCFSLLDLIKSLTRLGGDVGEANSWISQSPEDTGKAHSESAIWLPFSTGIGSGWEGGRATPAFLLPLSALGTHSAHASGI